MGISRPATSVSFSEVQRSEACPSDLSKGKYQLLHLSPSPKKRSTEAESPHLGRLFLSMYSLGDMKVCQPSRSFSRKESSSKSKTWCHHPCHLSYMIQQPSGVRGVSDGKKCSQGPWRTLMGEPQSWPLSLWRKQKITYHLKISSWQITEGKLLYSTMEHQMMSQNFPLQIYVLSIPLSKNVGWAQ